MRLGVVGGKLQGIEAAYLAGEAGYEVVLVDRGAAVPAAGLVDEVHTFDVIADPTEARKVLGRCDAVLPACEDSGTLQWLAANVPAWGVPLLFHPPSYAISSSKLTSDRLFATVDVPRPIPWPESGLPAVVKPSGASGSEGVHVVEHAAGLARARRLLEAAGHEVVVQEYVDGPSLSLEVLAFAGRVVTLLPTLLEFDRSHDCKRVVAPVEGDIALMAALHAVGRRLAEGVGLVGLMDVEVMVRGSVPKVIEIDARLPSQTPTAVYHCCGVNIVSLLCDAFCGRGLAPTACAPRRGVVYEHVRVAAGEVEVVGEQALARARPLRRRPGFYGATQALTDHAVDASDWVATLIVEDVDAEAARRRADSVVRDLAADLGMRVVPSDRPMARTSSATGAETPALGSAGRARRPCRGAVRASARSSRSRRG